MMMTLMILPMLAFLAFDFIAQRRIRAAFHAIESDDPGDWPDDLWQARRDHEIWSLQRKGRR